MLGAAVVTDVWLFWHAEALASLDSRQLEWRHCLCVFMRLHKRLPFKDCSKRPVSFICNHQLLYLFTGIFWWFLVKRDRQPERYGRERFKLPPKQHSFADQDSVRNGVHDPHSVPPKLDPWNSDILAINCEAKKTSLHCIGRIELIFLVYRHQYFWCVVESINIPGVQSIKITSEDQDQVVVCRPSVQPSDYASLPGIHLELDSYSEMVQAFCS